jgi:2,4-dienoyl-CoA reductase (NADPH2)
VKDIMKAKKLLDPANGVIVETRDGRKDIASEKVICAVGSHPFDDLSTVISRDKERRVIVIGDARKPRKILDAIREGFDAVLDV